jgi:FkbM family methyltransferase
VPGFPPFRLHTHERPDHYITRDLRKTGMWEPLETSVLLGILAPGSRFVDLGANIGYYTVLASLATGPRGKVYAFEPDPGNFELLERNIALNRVTNVTAVNAAASSHGGTARLFLSADNQGDHRLYDNESRPDSVPVNTVALDDWFLDRDRRIDVIKMDTQGFEVQILDGMRGLLEENCRHLHMIVEFWPFGLQGAGHSAEDLVARLRPLGFKVQKVDERFSEVKPTSWEALIAEAATIYAPSRRDFTNLLLSPAN